MIGLISNSSQRFFCGLRSLTLYTWAMGLPSVSTFYVRPKQYSRWGIELLEWPLSETKGSTSVVSWVKQNRVTIASGLTASSVVELLSPTAPWAIELQLRECQLWMGKVLSTFGLENLTSTKTLVNNISMPRKNKLVQRVNTVKSQFCFL